MRSHLSKVALAFLCLPLPFEDNGPRERPLMVMTVIMVAELR